MMMRGLGLICGVLVLGTTMCQARSRDGVPDLNVKQSCREAQAVSADGDSRTGGDGQVNTYNACMQDEMQARDTLAQHWSKFKPINRQNCVSQANPSPSYVEILTCLEMNDAAGIPYKADSSGLTPTAAGGGAAGSPSARPTTGSPAPSTGGAH